MSLINGLMNFSEYGGESEKRILFLTDCIGLNESPENDKSLCYVSVFPALCNFSSIHRLPNTPRRLWIFGK